MSDTEKEVTQLVKKKTGRYYTNSLQSLDEFDSSDERAAYNSKALTDMMDVFNLPSVQSTEEAIERTTAYFQRCANKGIKPTVEEYALALGIHRQTLWNWIVGNHRGPVDPDVVRRAKDFIAAYDARMVSDGKLNPVTYIFRAKNYYDMKDTQDVVVTPNQFETRTREEIIREAEALPED